MHDAPLAARTGSELLEVADDVSCVPFTLRGGDAAVGVLLKLAGEEALVEDLERHLAVIGLLVHPLQLCLQLQDPLGLLLGLHGGHFGLLILSWDVRLLPPSL